ncbi:esterase-like activity of phytase family protein [Micromonospora sp. NIE79]|uniref:Esterase-like activity of phytase family protein n=1 Tax=Micromonospora trifolii TaxID=2911208 RepID=A0ABS9MVE4_9ACTN|nr:esterase-like activity of phytase family protein [Micromonospora trifolii]MCG5441656.1 esterase-like activity of phytase family protein [Micromonospora trifolii]
MRVRGRLTWGRRARAGAVLTALLAGVVPPAVVLAPGAATAGAAAAGTPVCQVRDDRLREISGMVATDDGYVVINDGADDEARRRIFFLDQRCAVTRTVSFPSRPRDTEDLAIGRDGTVWVADIGDNDRTRTTVGVWRLAPGAKRPVLHRMTYPDRPHDAEALLLDASGRPLIVTKGGSGTVFVYAPTTALRSDATTPLTPLGQVTVPSTTTSNPFSFLGRGVITGAASAPDGRRVVLRSYADAFEYDVPDGDVVRALTTGTPRITPLPDEPQGESITYSRDGRSLLTVSESAGQPAGTRSTILRYPATATTATAAPPTRSDDPVAPTAVRPAAGEVGGGEGGQTWPLALGAGTLLVLLGVAAALWWRHTARQ